MVYLVMGVSGSGKSLIGLELATKMNIPFYDADDYHPKENIKKMANSQPLDLEDRLPWLITLAKQITHWNREGHVVLACSALKETYRDLLRLGGDITFIYLKGDKDLLLERLETRDGHFMPATLLQSQLDTLEEPKGAITGDINLDPEPLVEQIIKKIEKI